jgi:hypothetical protein
MGCFQLTWTFPYGLCYRPVVSAYLVSCIWCAPIYCVITFLRRTHDPQLDISLVRTEDNTVIVLSPQDLANTIDRLLLPLPLVCLAS